MDIQGPDNLSPQQKKEYQEACQRGVRLFEEALKNYHDTKASAQKEKFKEVMQEALKLISQATRECSPAKQASEKKLEEDYQKYMKKEEESSYSDLLRDIQDIEESWDS